MQWLSREETLQFVLEVYFEAQKTGKSIKQVCREKGISYRSFYQARERVKEWDKKGKLKTWLSKKERELLYGKANS